MKAGTAKRGDRIIEDWDFGDREAMTGTVYRIREPRWPSDRGMRALLIRWDDGGTPRCTQLPESYVRLLPGQAEAGGTG